jgi:hypothetical protein
MPQGYQQSYPQILGAEVENPKNQALGAEFQSSAPAFKGKP